MKAWLEAWLLKIWFGASRPPFWLRMWVPLYRWLAVRDRTNRSAKGKHALRVPVLVIGNFTVGGSGKTPLCIAVVQHLRQRGWRPGVVSRGYGREGDQVTRVSAGHTASEVGDEPLLIFKRTLEHVQVDRDRLRGAKTVIDAGCDIVIADDGLQHHALPRDIEIEVVDSRGYGNGDLLPAGPLREAPRSCDLRVRNLGADNSPPEDARTFDMHLRPTQAARFPGGGRRALSDFRSRKVHALAGIGHPKRFFDALRGQGIEVIEHPLPDHHPLQAEALPNDGLPVMLTEKDAVKLAFDAVLPAEVWVVPVEAELPKEFWRALDAMLDGLRPGRGESRA